MNIAFYDERKRDAAAVTAAGAGGGDQDDPLPAFPVFSSAELVNLAEIVLVGERLPEGTEVAITLVDLDQIAALNAEHMGKEGPTDVLSFPIEDLSPGIPPQRAAGEPPIDLGDVVISPDKVWANAAAAGVDAEDELALMVVHGLLHLLGYDHVADADAEVMESREQAHLAKIGRTRP